MHFTSFPPGTIIGQIMLPVALGPRMVKHAVPSASLKDPLLVQMTPSSDAIKPRILRVELLIAG